MCPLHSAASADLATEVESELQVLLIPVLGNLNPREFALDLMKWQLGSGVPSSTYAFLRVPKGSGMSRKPGFFHWGF